MIQWQTSIKHKMAISERELGKLGEWLACEYLKGNGYQLVCSNFKTFVGRNIRGASITAEIDIVAYDGDTLCFVEVKTRTSDDFTSPASAVDLRKQRQVIRAARAYRKIMGLEQTTFRYDVVSVVMNPMKIELLKGFFNESRFKKKRWA